MKAISIHLSSPDPEVIELFSCSTPLKIVGILTFISMINKNKTSDRLKAIKSFIYHYYSFYEQLKFCAQLSKLSMKKVL